MDVLKGRGTRRFLDTSGDSVRNADVMSEEPAEALLGDGETLLAGAYALGAPIAQGGMGMLYRATHTRTGRDVVLKVLHQGYQGNELAEARFRREGEVLAKLQNPHVVQILDLVTASDGRHVIVFEHLRGRDLGKVETPMATEDALRIIEEVCRGLEVVHRAGIIHRDIKPTNIFLARTGEKDGATTAKIVDFGVAHIREDADLTKDGVVVGTPAFMAPEQVHGAKVVDERADLYGVGAVLYRLLTGKSPYEADSPTAVLAKVLEGPPAPPSSHRPGIPAAVEDFVMRAMSRKPGDRFESARDMADHAADLRSKLLFAQRSERSPLRRSLWLALVVLTGAGIAFRGALAFDWVAANSPWSVLFAVLGGLLTYGALAATTKRSDWPRQCHQLGKHSVVLLSIFGVIELVKPWGTVNNRLLYGAAALWFALTLVWRSLSAVAQGGRPPNS